VVSVLDSRLEGRGFKPPLDVNGVKAMSGLILVHLLIEKKENVGSQMGHIKKNYLKNLKKACSFC